MLALLALDQSGDGIVYADVWPLLWAVLMLLSFGIVTVLSMRSPPHMLGDPYPVVRVEGCGRMMAIALVAGLGLAALGVAGAAAVA
jgi:hypothetical protein